MAEGEDKRESHDGQNKAEGDSNQHPNDWRNQEKWKPSPPHDTKIKESHIWKIPCRFYNKNPKSGLLFGLEKFFDDLQELIGLKGQRAPD